MTTKLSKSQKIIILLSVFWTVIGLLIAGGVSSDSYSGFNLVAFFAVLLAFSAPVWIYWAGVWIWGFGYIIRVIKSFISLLKSKKIHEYAKKLTKSLLIIISSIFILLIFVFFLGAIGIEIPPGLVGILTIIIIASINNQKKRFGTNDFSFKTLVLITSVATLSCVGSFYGTKHLRQVLTIEQTMEAVEEQYPAYKALREREPEIYKRIKDAIVSGIKAGKTNDELANLTSLITAAYIQEKLPHLPDDIVVRKISADLNMAKNLMFSAPQKCVNILIGKPFGDLSKLLKPEIINNEMLVLNEIIETTKIEEPKILTEEESETTIVPIYVNEAKARNIPTEEYYKIFNGDAEPYMACGYLVAVMQSILSLPPETAAAYFRYELF